jgi:hypothetical protein
MKTTVLNKQQFHMMTRNEFSSSMSILIDTKQDIRSLPTVVEKFIGTDLTRVSILVIKHQ